MNMDYYINIMMEKLDWISLSFESMTLRQTIDEN